ncbi:uncharacterized protein RCO7_10711 [Rhynchosporium graminicola]|uniref:Heterokaryon incompatibility domain-containing protein n=1 Tax=Rhynchosporium graminicola TaxID=2792576 RepID=A0A1E1L2S5_9HELO|nr:uncharacterized protein RCO7_10711 [Rhynchosporium commune]
MADSPLDPQLTSRGDALPVRNIDDVASESENEEGANEGQNDARKKRQKLNLWKCRQCREARKKCLPEGRVWPEKCQRCLQHRPGELECSKPEVNNRTRGKNVPKGKDTTPVPSTAVIIPDRATPIQNASVEDAVKVDSAVLERPKPMSIPKGTKRDRKETFDEPLSELSAPISEFDKLPAAVYLPINDSQFRILRLKPGDPEDLLLQCSFEVHSIDSPPEYEAISYLWGSNNEHEQLPSSHKIVLFDNLEIPRSHTLFIRKNLHTALRTLRHLTEVRCFWVDALCIRRINTQEKNQQVDMKKKIFKRAKNVCFWLGDEPEHTAALAFIGEIINLKEVDKLINDPNVAGKWVAFIRLLKNNIFNRLWIVQEVALARNVTLHCGAPAPAIHYTDFVDAVTIFLSCRKHISELFRRDSDKEYEKHIRGLTDRKITMVERFVDVTTNALRRSSESSTDQTVDNNSTDEQILRQLTLEALVSNLSDLSSGDPRDRIYSVLALAKDGPSLSLNPNDSDPNTLQIDYTKSVLQIYQEFFVKVVSKSKDLDIMCRRWAYSASQKEDLPTWIRPVPSNLQLPFDSNISERTDADSLVGIPNHKWYNAAKDTKADAYFVSNPSSLHKRQSLTVEGFCLDTISRLGQRASEGFIFYEWLQLGGCKLGEEDYVPDPFWRTLVADRGPDGSNAPSWYHRALLYCLADKTPNGDINTNKLIATFEAGSNLVVEFLQRVQSVIWNRKFLVTQDHKLIGLAPMAARQGDMVCILYGCSVPVVLKKKEKDGDTFWQVVGECYVHGKMNGEAMDDQHETQKFELR